MVEVGNHSSSQTYTVSGDNLTGDVTVTAPAQFQVSTDNINFSPLLTLPQASGDLIGEPVTIYARFSPTSAGSASGNITHTSPSATTQTVAVSGTGVNPPVTYTWNVDADGDFNDATKWNPNRTAPAINDILVFDGNLLTGTRTISNLPESQMIGQLRLINNASIIFTADAADATLTLDGNVAGVDFEIQSGSTLRLDTTSNDRTIIIPSRQAKLARLQAHLKHVVPLIVCLPAMPRLSRYQARSTRFLISRAIFSAQRILIPLSAIARLYLTKYRSLELAPTSTSTLNLSTYNLQPLTSEPTYARSKSRAMTMRWTSDVPS